MSSQTFFSPGKLLLTSEYFVLDGASALAVPSILGQEMEVEEIQDGKSLLIWQAFHENLSWLNTVIDYKNWQITETNIPESAEFILNVFKVINDLSDLKFSNSNTCHFRTNLQFPANFGLGSSSTLMVNLAAWADVDPFVLNEICLSGSGYDIAVAVEKSALLFQKNKGINHIKKVIFDPPFLDDLILIHLNQKQNSREGIELYRSKNKSLELIEFFSDLTNEVQICTNLEIFSDLMEKHESQLSEFLGLPTVKSELFQDCPVFVKSLGAWGGDFVLSRKFPNYKSYFSNKNYRSIFGWAELVKTN